MPHCGILKIVFKQNEVYRSWLFALFKPPPPPPPQGSQWDRLVDKHFAMSQVNVTADWYTTTLRYYN